MYGRKLARNGNCSGIRKHKEGIYISSKIKLTKHSMEEKAGNWSHKT